MEESGNVLSKLLKIKLAVGGAAGCASLFLLFFPLFVVVLLVLGLFGDDSSGGGIVSSNNSECGFTISQTSLSKSEFKSLIQEYANSHSQWQVFADNANDYYDYAKAKGVNPELVVLVANKENGGYITHRKNNYWGLNCLNGREAETCKEYNTFLDGAKAMIDSASSYSRLIDWFNKGHYSYIGYYWYNTSESNEENTGRGGCYYASHIAKFYPGGVLPENIKKACTPGNWCYQVGESGGSAGCLKTTEDDQTAYSKWLVDDKMAKPRETIFKLAPDEGVSCTSNPSGVVEKYVQWMIGVANDDTHGYSQFTSDGGSGRTFNPDVDCSSFVYYALLKGAEFTEEQLGISDPFTTTWNMDTALKNVGFKSYSYTSETELQRGDILWSADHTEVYIGNGQNVGAHSNKDGKSGDSSGEEVDIGDNWRSWTSYYRYEGDK